MCHLKYIRYQARSACITPCTCRAHCTHAHTNLTGNGRSIHKHHSHRSTINHRQENLVSFATATIVEVSLQTEVQNVIANYSQGCRKHSFLPVRFPNLTIYGRSLSLVKIDVAVASCVDKTCPCSYRSSSPSALAGAASKPLCLSNRRVRLEFELFPLITGDRFRYGRTDGH